MAAASRETDTTIWLNNKLGSTDDLWSGNSICSQLSKDRLLTIIDCFHTLQAHVKVKLLLSFIHISKRISDNMDWKRELEELYRIACNDADLWVSTVADILRTFPSTGSLNAEVKDNHVIFHEIISDLRKLVRKGQDVSMYPLEGCYLSRSALISVAGPLQPPAKHFALKRRPKSAALRVELLQKSTDAANNLKKNVSTYPVKMRSFAKKMNDDTPMRGILSQVSSGFASKSNSVIGRFTGLSSNQKRDINNQKEGGIKLLEFDALPLSAKETKKRKKMELEMQKTAKKEEQATLSSPTSIASPTQSTSTTAATQSSSSTMPDYAAGLLAVTSFDSLATSTATNLMNQTVTPTSAFNNLTSLTANNLITLQAVQQQQQQPPQQQQLTTSSLLSPNIILPSPTSNPQTIRFTVVPSSAAQQQQQIFLSARQPQQQIRQIILTTPALNIQQQLQQQPQQSLQQTIVLRPANQLQQTAATTMNKMLSANNPIVIRASASSLNNINNNNNNNAIIINNINNLNSLNLKNLNIKSINMNVHNNNNNTATNATNEVVQFAPTNLSTNNTISSANNNNTVIINNNNNKATILNTPRHVIRTLQPLAAGQPLSKQHLQQLQQLQLQQQQQQLLQQQQQQQQQQSVATTSTAEESQPKKELILTREQVFEAQEMFKIFPNITRAEKALILGFMAGARDNPCPNQGPVLNIRLGETVESIEQPDGAFHPMVVETHLQLNYSSGEFKQFRKIRDREVDAE